MTRYNVAESSRHILPTAQLNMGPERQTGRCAVQQFNELIVCAICKGYMIDPTAVDQCYHTYCRSCILKHLMRDAFCPLCKPNCGKPINEENLKSDDILRAFIYKVVPGLYQRESNERLAHHEAHVSDLDEVVESTQEFFSPTEPISLSLEYHPVLLKQCTENEVPPVCYLQCPASVKIHHLKRFLCSKYDIDPENKLIAIEVIYEDEVLPNDFSLMDVGYCYNWQRHAPMAFCYRVLLYDSSVSNEESKHAKVSQEIELSQEAGPTLTANQEVSATAIKREGTNSNLSTTTTSESNLHTKTVTFAEDDRDCKSEHKVDKLPKDKDRVDDVKVVVARKSFDVKKSSAKRVAFEESSTTIASKNDFKSLRSNDVRCSPCDVTASVATTQRSKPKYACEPLSKCDIVVSIPQSQLSGSTFEADETFELKTANKKSPNLAKNLPKLKIELNSMKTQLMTIPKPKSASARLEAGKRRKSLFEEPLPATGPEIDLKTYAKNIGLKPIESLPIPNESCDSNDKSKHSSPSASPMSSCSSTSNGSFCLGSSAVPSDVASTSRSSSSSHKKRKKKHSKDLKDSNGKRKKLHAEISSQTDGKMKMKITATHKSHKLEVKRSHSVGGGETFGVTSGELESVVLNKLKLEETAGDAESKSLQTLNKTLGEEALSINNLMSMSKQCNDKSPMNESDKQEIECKTESLCGKSNPTSKPLEIVKDLKNISSPPLPPSLFKSAPLPFTTIQSPTTVTASSATTAPSNLKHTTPKAADWSKIQTSNATQIKPTVSEKSIVTTRYPTTTTTVSNTTAKFAVPNPPRYEHSVQRYLSTPTSIASAANKNAGLQMKRSLSLDESQPYRANTMKQPRLEQERYAMVQRKTNPVAKCPKPAANNAQSYAALYSPTGRAFGPETLKSRTLQLSSPGVPANPSISIAQTPISTGAVTITPRPRVSMALASTQPHNFPFHYGTAPAPYNKPALEIVRITPNKLPADKQSALNQPHSNSNANQRLMGPPIGQLKAKKTQTQPKATQASTPTIVKSPPLPVTANYHNVNNAYRTSPPALINLRNTIPFPFPSKSSTSSSTSIGESSSKKSATVAVAVAAGSKANGTALLDRSKTSLREFRPTSKDGSVDILDLSAGRNAAATKPEVASTKNADLGSAAVLSAIALKKSLTLTPTSTSSSTTSSSSSPLSSTNSLEAALNKIKQNISASSAVSNVETGSDDLQNLQMLSESATARIKPTNIFDPKLKPQQSSMVRQQNASVRSIPNPSALFNRNQTTLSTPTSKPTVTVSSSGQTQVSLPASSPSSEIAKSKPTDVKTGQCPNSSLTLSTNLPTTSTSTGANSSTSLATSPRTAKKLTTIDQVAANLNIRAAAAEASAARAAIGEESASPSTESVPMVSSSSVTKPSSVSGNLSLPNANSESLLSKPTLVNMAATETLTTVASSA